MTKTSSENSLPRSLFIVEDHSMMRWGLSQYLHQQAGLTICGEATTAADALRGIEQTHPDLVLLDISLVGRSGLDLLKDLKIRFPHTPVLVHSMHDELIFAERALNAGARGYLMKNETGEQLIVALNTVLHGEIYLSPRLLAHNRTDTPKEGRAPPLTPIASLTDREFEVFHLIGRGFNNREIAQHLALSLKTVEAHRDHIKRKLHLTSSTALNLLAVRWESDQAGHLGGNPNR